MEIANENRKPFSIHAPVVLSFDVEEHYRIEAAKGFACPADLRDTYAARMETVTRKLLDTLAERNALATFYIVGQIAVSHPKLVRDIHAAGHEVGSHSWDHQSVHYFTPQTFREDLLRSKDALEQCIGEAIHGFRAPTFSVVRQTAWAIDVLAECGFEYDSSIFPVQHDRYGIPDAPRTPFLAIGRSASILELPPTTLRYFGMNIPVAGGGYFRLFPLSIMQAGIRQSLKLAPALAMLYFHPWEFDVDQPRLPLGRLARLRTYVGVTRTMGRLRKLMLGRSFARAIDVVKELKARRAQIPEFSVVDQSLMSTAV
jgi:polysaccharide deacetylase family protein (PEP-CTERM system associated)